jgi:hypothetical protein
MVRGGRGHFEVPLIPRQAFLREQISFWVVPPASPPPACCGLNWLNVSLPYRRLAPIGASEIIYAEVHDMIGSVRDLVAALLLAATVAWVRAAEQDDQAARRRQTGLTPSTNIPSQAAAHDLKGLRHRGDLSPAQKTSTSCH